MRKAQTAVEFLTTYAWVILGVIIFVVALLYYGIFNPLSLISRQCSFDPGLPCTTYKVELSQSTGYMRVITQLSNNLGYDISLPEDAMLITTDNLGRPGKNIYVGNCSPKLPYVIKPGGLFTCVVNIRDNELTPPVGKNLKLDAQLKYKNCLTDPNYTATGDCSAAANYTSAGTTITAVESYSAASPTLFCGDGTCSASIGENPSTCPPDCPVPTSLFISANPEKVPPGGSSTVTAVVSGASGPMPDVDVTFVATAGTLSSSVNTTNVSGAASVGLTSTSVGITADVVATVYSLISNTSSVTFCPSGCINGDSCCPAGCDSTTDSDCAPPVCPTGVCEPGENCQTCPADCPCNAGIGELCCGTSCGIPFCNSQNDPLCNDFIPCTTDSCSNPGTCSAACSNILMTSCSMTSDGCCPAGCTPANDADCVCNNNGTCDTGETYLNCPADCCEADCTAKYDNTCHGECRTYAGCSNFITACNGQAGSTATCADGFTTATCCSGTPTSCGTDSTGCSPDYCDPSDPLHQKICKTSGCNIPCADGVCTTCFPNCQTNCETCIREPVYCDPAETWCKDSTTECTDNWLVQCIGSCVSGSPDYCSSPTDYACCHTWGIVNPPPSCHTCPTGVCSPLTGHGFCTTLIETQLSQDVDPPSPTEYGLPITFSCDYTTTSGSGIDAASVFVNMDGGLDPTTPLGNGVYQYTTSTLTASYSLPHSWRCEASKSGYSPQTHTSEDYSVTPTATNLDFTVVPPSGPPYGTLVTFTCSYTRLRDNAPVTEPGTLIYITTPGVSDCRTTSGPGFVTCSNDSIPVGLHNINCFGTAPSYQGWVKTITYTITPGGNIPTTLSLSASPPSPSYPDTLITFQCRYTTTDSQPIQGATVTFTLTLEHGGGTTSPMSYNSTSGNYTFGPFQVLVLGAHTWSCDATKTGYQQQQASSPYTIIDRVQVCGNNICETGEDYVTCCQDCDCPGTDMCCECGTICGGASSYYCVVGHQCTLTTCEC